MRALNDIVSGNQSFLGSGAYNGIGMMNHGNAISPPLNTQVVNMMNSMEGKKEKP